MIESKSEIPEYAITHISETKRRLQNPEKFSSGPIYHITTSKGFKINIHCLVQIVPEENKNELPKRAILLVAEHNGNLAGIRTTIIRDAKLDNNNDDYLYGTGRIDIIDQAKGIGTVLELAHLDLLQRLANAEARQVKYQVYDHRDIDSSEKGWLRLYGKDGLLGTNDEGEIVVDTGDYHSDYSMNTNVDLHRDDYNDGNRDRIRPRIDTSDLFDSDIMKNINIINNLIR